MKNTFYRPETIDTMEMEKIIAKLMEDFREIKSGNVSFSLNLFRTIFLHRRLIFCHVYTPLRTPPFLSTSQ